MSSDRKPGGGAGLSAVRDQRSRGFVTHSARNGDGRLALAPYYCRRTSKYIMNSVKIGIVWLNSNFVFFMSDILGG